MAYILGTHLVNCAHCKCAIFRDEAVRDRSGYLVCKKHKNERQMGVDYPFPRVRPDNNAVPASQRQGAELESTVDTLPNTWENIALNWEDISTNWEDL